ncbi:MAG: hypothetical protein M1821_007873 [Bathelium mastoideum]|nr:MAG: hypothetical protein M1821_007873 [Bathelium mastoideum]
MPRPKRARVTPSAPVNTASRRAAAAENAKSSGSSTTSGARQPLANVSNTVGSLQANASSSDAVTGPAKNARRGRRQHGREIMDGDTLAASEYPEGVEAARITNQSEAMVVKEMRDNQKDNKRLGSSRTRQGKATVKNTEIPHQKAPTERSARKKQKSNINRDQTTTEEEGGELIVDISAVVESEPLPEAQVVSKDVFALGSPGQHASSPDNLDRILQQIPSSAQRVRNTPGGDTSILALGNWKRRPRQPSVVRTTRQQLSDHDTEDSFELPVSDDFDPDDESTPLKSAGVQPQARSSEQASKSVDLGTSSSRKRKRTTPPAERVSSGEQSLPGSASPSLPQSPQTLPSDSVEATNGQNTAADESLENSNGTHTSRQRNEEPEFVSETQASPLSSSPLARSPLMEQSRPKKSVRQSNNVSVTRSAGQVKQNKKSKRLTTAELTMLLPQRRPQRRPPGRSDFEILSSSGQDVSADSTPDDDEDELAPRHSRVKQSRTAQPSRKKAQQAPRSTKQQRQSKKAVKDSGTSKLKRTYGRASSDKENQDEEDAEPSEFMQHLANSDEAGDTIVVSGNKDKGKGGREKKGKYRKSLELSSAAKKFAEVDEWEMEFESVETGGRSSSPWR